MSHLKILNEAEAELIVIKDRVLIYDETWIAGKVQKARRPRQENKTEPSKENPISSLEEL